MCGIVGLVCRTPPTNRELLDSMRDSLRHRGPDDGGSWWSTDGRVGLANRRLAIIDLSVAGHQPMADASGRRHITFNGEIYNHPELRRELERYGHSFRSTSDTEVILAAYQQWGQDCLAWLRGMFAFAIHDEERGRLLLVRDRAGEKPLFYWQSKDRLLFGSELKALMADPSFPRVLDLESLDFYLAFGYVPGARCILQGVHKLEPGHALSYDIGQHSAKIWRYWKLPRPDARREEDPESLALQLEGLLENAVRRQLIADVPVGILLSGGVDSSLVTAMAARVSGRTLKTFTVSFPGHGTYDESVHARIVAEHFGTEHTELTAEPASVDLLPDLARQYDEPIADSSMVPTYLVSRLIRRSAKVALGGDGGDELFGGYPHHSLIQRQESVRRWIPHQVRSVVESAAARLLPVGLRGRNYLMGAAADLQKSIANVNIFFDRHARRDLLTPGIRAQLRSGSVPEAYKIGLCTEGASPLQQATIVDFQTYLPEDILAKVDRASMLVSLEVRAPWLDTEIIEFAFSRVPDDLRATSRTTKILPRLLAQRLLPPALDLTRKQGFSLPLQSWFRASWGPFVEDVLHGADTRIFNRNMILSLIAGQRRGFSNTSRLFALTMFELWRRDYRIEIPN